MRQASLDQIQVVRKGVQDYERSLEATLPLLRDVDSRSVVVVGPPVLPDNLTIGEPVEVTIPVLNTSALDAMDVRVELFPGSNIQVLDGGETSLGTLMAGATGSASFQLVPTTESGMMRVAALTSNGVGASRMLYLVATEEDADSIPGTASGGGGGMLALLLGVAVIAGVVAVVYGRRKRKGRTGAASTQATAALIDAGGNQFAVRDGTMVGRSATCDLPLQDPYVSRQHARFRYSQGVWYIQDMNSSTGTFVNDTKVQATQLQSGDRIKVGSYIFVFQA